MKKQPTAYFVSHNGLGDNITNIGAVNFLLQYYETIHFLCKDIYAKNVEYLFSKKPVVVVLFDSHNEFSEIKRILGDVSKNADIFVSGMHKHYIQKRITHPQLLLYKQSDKNYTVEFDHIREFYYDIGLDLSIYYEYFDIESTETSEAYYHDLKGLKIIFIHSKASNREVKYDDVYEKYKNNKEYIMICANKNMYEIGHQYYEIAAKYVNIYVALYIDIIKQAEFLYMVDSCFSCIVYPMTKTNRIDNNKFNLYIRKS